MLVSKQKSKLAYAKTGHNKSSSALAPSSLVSGCQTPKHSKQNIVDELISQLGPDQTSYLNELIEKQEKKNKKGKEKTKNKGIDSFRDKTNKCGESQDDKKINKLKNSKRFSKEESSARKSKRSERQNNIFKVSASEKEKNQQSRINLPFAQNAIKSSETNSFISNIEQYLATIAQHRPQSADMKNFQSPQTPKTSEISQQQEFEGEDIIRASSQEFQELTNELHEALEANELLQQALQQKDDQIQQMKFIIQKLCSQVTTLRGKLATQHKVNKNFQLIFNQFSSQMQQARSSSKPKQSQKQHSSHKNLQRYSFVPSAYQEERIPRRSEMPGSQFRNTYDYSQLNKFKEQSLGLKKKNINSKNRVYNIRNSCACDSPISEDFYASGHEY